MKNNRTFLEKLLDGAEVEWKPLDEVANIVNNARKPVKSSLRVSGNIPYYGANNIQDYVEGYTHEGEFVLIAEDGSASLENYSIQWAVGKFWANNHVHVVNGKEKLNNRFLYHYLTNMNFIPFLAGKERAKLTKAKLQQIPIPIPPPSVQTEIVKILDALTALTSELTSELILRQKQYEYYREKLLSEEELGKVGFEWRALKDILIRTKGTKITAAEMKVLHKENAPLKIFAGGKTFALVNYSDIPEKDINKNPSIIVKSRGIIEFEYYDKPFSHKNEMWSYYSNDKNINIKYIYYVLKNQEPYFQSLGSKMQMPQIAIPDTDKYLVPIPPPYIQTEIVKVLDKFVNLTNSISEGLPLAIEQSQKRYEYYKELLLSFS
ncbi:TPA: restriction endonuclease subunit S [Haemophilus influenzae]|uniref:restriction endonuclease subunit S n=1 Tax=Haemophilus influenzae TaxID=727 RepID=UPI001CC3F078|nr:restriction endonuclease subunit S [Haemophilus influenzae]MBZ5691657.1 restriction endonuclease subunit S [Haemophilus influenzae]